MATHLVHMRTHSDEARFSCLVCDKKFAQQQNLRLHMRKHTGEHPYKWWVNVKATGWQSTILILTLISISLASEECGKTFAYPKSYRSHMRLHSGEKPYTCSVCQKTFRHSNTIKRHMRTHTGEKPFSCVYCNKTFCHKHTMAKHMQRHQPNETAVDEDVKWTSII